MRRGRWLTGLAIGLAVAAVAGPGAGAQETPPTTVAPTTTVAPETTTTTTVAPTTTTEPAPTTTVVTDGTPSPAPEGNRNISGTIHGIDGKAVNAQISLVLRDAQDFPLNMDGTRNPSRAAYAETVSMNPHLPIDGGPPAGANDLDWQISGLPSNAHHFTLEVYPRAAGSGAGVFSHYGGAVKRNLRLRPGQSIGNIEIVFPLNCGVGGTTGSIRVRHYVNGNPSGNLDNFVATGADFPSFGIQGFRDQRDIPAGESAPEFDGLAPDRRYGVEIFVDPPSGPTRRFTFFEVPVRECQRTDIIISEGNPSAVPPRFRRLPVGAQGPGFPVPGDFDGDGDDDIYFAAPNAGTMWTSNGTGKRLRPVAAAVQRHPPGRGRRLQRRRRRRPLLLRRRRGRRPDLGVRHRRPHQVVAARADMGGGSTYPIAGDFDFNRRTDILFVSPGGADTMRRFTAAVSHRHDG